MGQKGGAVPGSQNDVRLQKLFRLLRKGLGHAAGENCNGVGVLLLRPPQGLAGLLIAGSGNGAGVHHHHIRRLLLISFLKAAAEQLFQHGLRFILIDLAAKGDKFYLHRWGSPFSVKVFPASASARATTLLLKPVSESRAMAFREFEGPGYSL